MALKHRHKRPELVRFLALDRERDDVAGCTARAVGDDTGAPIARGTGVFDDVAARAAGGAGDGSGAPGLGDESAHAGDDGRGESDELGDGGGGGGDGLRETVNVAGGDEVVSRLHGDVEQLFVVERE